MSSAFENIKTLLIQGGTSGIDEALNILIKEYQNPNTPAERKIEIAQSLEQLETVRNQRRQTYENSISYLSKRRIS